MLVACEFAAFPFAFNTGVKRAWICRIGGQPSGNCRGRRRRRRRRIYSYSMIL
jgi:hypothetical protein